MFDEFLCSKMPCLLPVEQEESGYAVSISPPVLERFRREPFLEVSYPAQDVILPTTSAGTWPCWALGSAHIDWKELQQIMSKKKAIQR